MRKIIIILISLILMLGLVAGVSATYNDVVIWDPNNREGIFTDLTSNFNTVLSHLSAAADVTVSGGGDALVTAVAAATSGTSADPYVIEVDSGTYDGGMIITDKTDIVIRAASGASPVIDCGVLGIGVRCVDLVASADRSISNIGIQGLTFKDIRYNNVGQAFSGHGIASINKKILENIVIQDNTFDNTDITKDTSFKGVAIRLPQVDGLLVRRNTILNSGLHSSNNPQEDGAIQLHMFQLLPNYLNNVFIQNNIILFDYTGMSVTASTRGIVLAHTGETATRFNNVVVEYNLIDNVQKEGIKIFGTSSDVTDDETTYVNNNVIKRTDMGIEADGGTILIDRTIFDGNPSDGSEAKDVGIDQDGATITISNSIVTEKVTGTRDDPITVNCIGLYNSVPSHPTLSVAGTFTNVDPMFVNPTINDYTIGNSALATDGCNGGYYGLEFVVPPPTEVWVDNVGDCDGNTPCFATIQEGIAAVASGGTVNVGEGTYTVASQLIVDDGKKLVADPNAVTQPEITFEATYNQFNDGAELRGLKIICTASQGGNVHINVFGDGSKVEDNYLECGFRFYGSSNAVVRGNTIKNCAANFVDFKGNAHDNIFEDNIVEDAGCDVYEPIAIELGSYNNIVTENTVNAQSYGHSIQIFATAGEGNTITLNTINNADQAGWGTAAVKIQTQNNFYGFDTANTDPVYDVVAGNTQLMCIPDAAADNVIDVPTECLTIQAAIDAANPAGGDTINVAAGTYDESVTINKNNLNIIGDSITRPAITGGLKLDTDLIGLTFKNFIVSGSIESQNSIVRMYGSITDLTINNSVFDGENVDSRRGFSGGQLEGDVVITYSEFKDILGWSLFDSRSGSGGDGSAMGTVTFANNYVHDSEGSVVFRGLSTDWTDHVYIYGNIFENIGNVGVSSHWAAFEVNRAQNVEIYDNTIRNVVLNSWGEGQAMQLWHLGTASIYDNTIENNYQGILIAANHPTPWNVLGVSIYQNSFSGNDQYALSVTDATSSVDAENNWWGALTGPYHSTSNPNGQGDTVSGNVDFDPWCTDSGCIEEGEGEGAGGASSISFTSSFTDWTVSTVKAALDWLFDRAEQDTEGVSIYLHQGWNTFKLPWFVLTGTAQNTAVSDYLTLTYGADRYDVDNVLNSIAGSYNYVAYYDDETNDWWVYSTAENEVITNDFTEFPNDPSDEDYDFHIYMTTPGRLVIEPQLQ